MRGSEHGHDHGFETEHSSRPKGDHLEATPDTELLGQAAAAGRRDVLGPPGILGLQRLAGNAATSAVMEEERSPVHDVVNSGGGSSLDNETRSDMEGRFGTSFSDVKVHTDGAAHASAKSVNAQAYTVGNNIVFQSGNYNPGSDAGRHMLAHELTHVVQQRSGPVDGSDAGGGVKVSDPGDRFEREASDNADKMMAEPSVQRCGDGCGHDHGGGESVQTYVPSATVQREGGEEEEETAQTYVQREEEEEETAQTYVQREEEEEAPEQA
ncbi:hypothetical protein Afil01_51750 [Actinorhabdospora filicis]|uniref:eCIS core domain-containing protein n=1 Tax=Actinorhabdospora filicis TaxID=1785913 RepID=A0A9W6SQQ0_9ACTN|nr:DUF4157 domain-containing protein [Actinorhabdospora filicis]GLZ80368.1 hypothetical protein Afil01_51750 [Actinorhabdospora filicis]